MARRRRPGSPVGVFLAVQHTSGKCQPPARTSRMHTSERSGPWVAGWTCRTMPRNERRSKSKRGFAAMSPAMQRQLSSRGGQASSGSFKNDREPAATLGRKGGVLSRGNFKNDPRRAVVAGRKGGSSSHGSGNLTPFIGQRTVRSDSEDEFKGPLPGLGGHRCELLPARPRVDPVGHGRTELRHSSTACD